jgi:hypothetical protein
VQRDETVGDAEFVDRSEDLAIQGRQALLGGPGRVRRSRENPSRSRQANRDSQEECCRAPHADTLLIA